MHSFAAMNRAATRTRHQRARRRRAVLRRRGTLHARWSPPAQRSSPRRSTLLALILELQQRIGDDAEVVRIVRWLVNSGRVVLSGSFAGRHF
jgi:hypothetical protein